MVVVDVVKGRENNRNVEEEGQQYKRGEGVAGGIGK